MYRLDYLEKMREEIMEAIEKGRMETNKGKTKYMSNKKLKEDEKFIVKYVEI